MGNSNDDDFDFSADTVYRPGDTVPVLVRMKNQLPKYREFSGIEAAYLIALDARDGVKRSGREYGRIFQWSTGKVLRFVDMYQLCIGGIKNEQQ